MTDTLHNDLAALAATATIPPLDVATVVRRGRRRQARARIALSAATLAVAAAAAGGAAALHTPRAGELRPAGPPAATVPTRIALQAALDEALPGSTITTADELGGAYLPEGTTAFAGRTRTGAVRAEVQPPQGGSIAVQWTAVDRPLDAAEARVLVGSITDTDPQGDQPPARLLQRQAIPGGEVRAYRISSPLAPLDAVMAWAGSGGYATLVQDAPTDAVAQARSVSSMMQLARLLVGTSETETAGPDRDSSRSQADLDREGSAVAACRDAVRSTNQWASTVRTQDDGFIVNVWRQPKPSGDPDYVCDARPDAANPAGVRVAAITPSPSG